MITQYFKTGADFEYPLELFDVDANASVAIAANMQIQASIAITRGGIRKRVSTCSVVPMAQVGFFKLIVPAAETSKWYEGDADIEVKMTIEGKVVISDFIPFTIEKSINP